MSSKTVGVNCHDVPAKSGEIKNKNKQLSAPELHLKC